MHNKQPFLLAVFYTFSNGLMVFAFQMFIYNETKTNQHQQELDEWYGGHARHRLFTALLSLLSVLFGCSLFLSRSLSISHTCSSVMPLLANGYQSNKNNSSYNSQMNNGHWRSPLNRRFDSSNEQPGRQQNPSGQTIKYLEPKPFCVVHVDGLTLTDFGAKLVCHVSKYL